MTINWLQAIVGAVFGLFLGSLFSDPLKNIWSALAQALSNRQVRKIAGRWDSTYWYEDNGQKMEHQDVIRLNQRGVYVSGKNEGRTDHEYEMTGQFRSETFLSGVWKSVKPEVTYHGTFQLEVSAHGKSMQGKWLGLSKRHGIRNGEWVLNKYE